MTLLNNGTISCKKEDLEEIIKIVNEAQLSESSIYSLDDAYESNGESCLEVTDVSGDIESQIKEIYDTCKENGIDISFDISYFGDNEGTYFCDHGVYQVLNQQESQLREMPDDLLLIEVKRRGLAQKVHDDVVRAFMANELVNGYGFSEEDAEEGAEIAFEYYVNTEGATQYDGIEEAVQQFDLRKSEKSASQDPVMYTYQFSYDPSIDGFGSVQFCASTIDEAVELFKEWEKENGHKIKKYSYNIVYNEEDAKEYGNSYGLQR